jgi:hypothetical protein
MAIADDFKRFKGGGMDQDSAPEDIDVNDYVQAENLRNTGSQGQDAGYSNNIESNTLLAGMLLAGINDCNGGGALDDIRQAAIFRTNSAGFNQILLYDYDSNTYTPIFTDKTDSAGQTLLPLDPANWVNCFLVNDTYLFWMARNLEVGYTNLTKLASGAYGTVLAEDLMLLKPQCLIPATGVYGSDAGRPANQLFGKLPQIIVQYENDEFNYSAWSTRSKRFVPFQQDTPVLGSDVSQNNYIVLSVNIGSIRATTINVGCQFDDSGVFSQIKTVTRAYVTALPNTSVNVATEVYEAYDPSTNLYSFAFYNDEVAIPIPSTETDLAFDLIWPCNTGGLLNGNIAGIGDWNTLYPRPVVPVTIAAIGYNPNIAIPSGTFPDPLRGTGSFPGASGSGAGDHKRIMSISLGGTPHTGDTIIVILGDIRNANNTEVKNYQVPSGLDGNLAGVITAYTQILPSATSVANGDGTYTITFIGDPFFGLQEFGVHLFFAGATVANSIASIPDNTVQQLALRHFDTPGRYFPLATDNTYIVNSPSYAQVNGNAIQWTWKINNPIAPQGAVRAQWMTTVAPVTKILDTLTVVLDFKGTWDPATNTPSLAVNSGTVGDTYQIIVPASPAVPTSYTNISNWATYNVGDYIVFNGITWDVLPKTFGDLTSTGNILAFSLNPLKMFNAAYANEGVNTVLVYDFAPNDRCTLHWYIANAAISGFTITPGSGYTNGTYENVLLTGGSGTNAKGTVTVAGGVITSVVLTNAGTGYASSDSLTGTVPGGTGWSITVNSTITGQNFINNPCVNLAVFGYDAGNYIVKVEKSATFDTTQLSGKNVFLRLYSPAPQLQVTEDTTWFEIGEPITITNGQYDTLSGTITDGGVYYKTRQFDDGLEPYTNPPVDVLATDLNYSDFYQSAFWSKGRVGIYYDPNVPEQSEQKALIVTSQKYVQGSRVNGLNRVYPDNVYGDQDGQCSSSQGSINVMWQRGNVLCIGQNGNWFYTPVNETYQVLNDQLTGIAISEKLLNNGRYETKGIGIQKKESFCTRYDMGYFVDAFDSQPMEISLGGVQPISGKMSKYFKALIQAAFSLGKRLHMYYDTYYEEVVFCIQSTSGIVKLFPFTNPNWNPNDSFVLAPGAITANNGSHSTVSYDPTTGLATYTPATNYVGNDVATLSFNPGSGVITKNVCLNWTAGSGNVNPFSFMELFGVPVNTPQQSNTILVSGNDFAVPISITGDPGLGYSINGGAFVSTPGTVPPGATVQVQVTSNAGFGASASCTLTIDGQSATFEVVTRAAGNFIASANYGMKIDSIVNGSGSGVPAGFNPCNLMPGMSFAAAYTSFAIGTYTITLDGSPAIPGHVYIGLSVGGVLQDSKLFTGPVIENLTNGTAATDPTIVEFFAFTMS